jgi:hypothetical protein
LVFKLNFGNGSNLAKGMGILYNNPSGHFVNKKLREPVQHDSDSSSDEEDFHKPDFDSDGEKEFVDDDSGYLVNTDSEDEGHGDVSDKSDSES